MAGEAQRKRLRALAARAGVRRLDASAMAALEEAFVHESAVREGQAPRSNERLEFLGDAVLGFVVARWLFARYPAANEGELALRKASLVSDAALAQSALAHEFEALMTFGAGLAKMPPARRRSALADAFEAWVAALYRVGDFAAAERFVIEQHLVVREAELESIDDPKTVLQEWSQRRYTRTPVYEERFEGPAHERVFFATVSVEGETLAIGEGPSKKTAQRAAAKAALEVLRARYDDVVPRVLSRAVDVASSQAKAGPRAKNGADVNDAANHQAMGVTAKRARANDAVDGDTVVDSGDVSNAGVAEVRRKRTRSRRVPRTAVSENAR